MACSSTAESTTGNWLCTTAWSVWCRRNRARRSKSREAQRCVYPVLVPGNHGVFAFRRVNCRLILSSRRRVRVPLLSLGEQLDHDQARDKSSDVAQTATPLPRKIAARPIPPARSTPEDRSRTYEADCILRAASSSRRQNQP